jgi:hypothetical protein
LWVKIDKQNAMAQLGQRGAEIYGRGRFADAAFLIRDCDDFHFEGSSRSGTMMLPIAPNVKLNFSDFRFGISK